jgi:DNA-binding response OmpR family regulator
VGRRILVVEDDDTIAAAIADRLRSEGFTVDVAGDGVRAVELVAATSPDLVVLDLGLPQLDGLEVCRRIRRDRHVPVLMVTARGDEADELTGLAVGADDYLTKPFSVRVLVARVHALLRRAGDAEPAAGAALVGGRLSIDRDRRRVHVDGVEAQLTATEFALLATLAERPGVVRSRAALLADVWGYHDGAARTIDSHVRALRRKLGDDVIRTVHGVGYALAEVAP